MGRGGVRGGRGRSPGLVELMSFDTLAPHYRWMERALAGGKLQRCRTEFLAKIPEPKRALLVGEGNGRFLSEFIHRFPKTKIVCLDASKKMLIEAKGAIGPSHSVEFVRADIFEWEVPAEKFDLIATNFFLDCFNRDQLEIVVSKLSEAAGLEGTWLLADFCEPPSGWTKWRARWILASMYLFFRFATKLPAKHLIAPDDLLREAGFELKERRFYDWGLLHADDWRRPARRPIESVLPA
jgi:ubiquinone/menaquinone biosynthesis C-methylase UbiE